MSDAYVECKNGVIRKRKTHCKHGHQFDGTEKWATNWRGFKCRVCRVCAKQRLRRKRDNPEYRANETAKMRRWRQEHRDAANTHIRAERRKKKQWLDAQKVRCGRCAETHVSCLEFHHREPAQKDFLLSVGVAKYSLKRLMVEVAKCEIICSNCHRKHHWQERQLSEGD